MHKSLTLDEVKQLLAKYLPAIQEGRVFSDEEYIEIGRLWNTVAFYKTLQQDTEAASFYKEVFDKVIPGMVEALHLTVGRGMSFYPESLQFTLGGILPANSRYRVPELESA